MGRAVDETRFPGFGGRRAPDLFASKKRISGKQRLSLWRWMVTTRQVEARLGILYRQGKVVGGLYRGEGQEGISVGSAMALEAGDICGPMIRDLGANMVRGTPPRDVFCQYMARATGPTQGRDCNTHFGDHDKGITAPISMLGALIPVVSGMAWAARNQGKEVVGLTYIGDGGSSTGDFHEGLNMAVTLNSPLILILENNGWAYSTPTPNQCGNEWFIDKAKGYGVRGIQVDGNQVEDVYRAVKEARAHAIAGGGPVLIEAITYRMNGHADHDDASYVPKELREAWRDRDPIILQAQALIEAGLATKEGLEAEQKDIFDGLKEDYEFALNSPTPEPVEASGGVYFGEERGRPDPRREARHS